MTFGNDINPKICNSDTIQVCVKHPGKGFRIFFQSAITARKNLTKPDFLYYTLPPPFLYDQVIISKDSRYKHVFTNIVENLADPDQLASRSLQNKIYTQSKMLILSTNIGSKLLETEFLIGICCLTGKWKHCF